MAVRAAVRLAAGTCRLRAVHTYAAPREHLIGEGSPPGRVARRASPRARDCPARLAAGVAPAPSAPPGHWPDSKKYRQSPIEQTLRHKSCARGGCDHGAAGGVAPHRLSARSCRRAASAADADIRTVFLRAAQTPLLSVTFRVPNANSVKN
ncbi:hypothetical protein EVAR_46464_1 [Eumeta japonica]|uniref:Uncharacterized protein n=1 Tax=Eumeta variegata TaxID=151549 RepID=A0A4C1XK91_EUMVA|nr:hypothetical protein EVAR_46464_1 [Eumeta japonica]